MKIIALFLMLLFAISSNAANGWHITTRYFNKNDNPASGRTEQIYLHNGLMKMIKGDLITIFDINNGEIIYINPVNKRFWRGKPSKFNAEVKAELEIMVEQKLMALNEAERDEMRSMYQEMLSATFSSIDEATVEQRNFTVSTGKGGEKVSGFSTVLYKVYEDGMPFENIWIAPELPISKDFDFISLSHFLNQLAGGSYAGSFENTNEYFNLIGKGYPVRIEIPRSDGTTQVSEVMEAKKVDLTSNDFTIPSGFTAGTLSDVGVWEGYE